MMGIRLDRPFPLYPDGFPPEVLEPFEEAIGRGVLGNVPASGTEIIQDLGDEHLRPGMPIVYTAATPCSRSRPTWTSSRSNSSTRGVASRAGS